MLYLKGEKEKEIQPWLLAVVSLGLSPRRCKSHWPQAIRVLKSLCVILSISGPVISGIYSLKVKRVLSTLQDPPRTLRAAEEHEELSAKTKTIFPWKGLKMF